MEVIQELANQLGVATEYVIGAYAPYYTARTIANTVIALLVLVVSTITFVKCISKYLKEKNIDGLFYRIHSFIRMFMGIHSRYGRNIGLSDRCGNQGYRNHGLQRLERYRSNDSRHV